MATIDGDEDALSHDLMKVNGHFSCETLPRVEPSNALNTKIYSQP